MVILSSCPRSRATRTANSPASKIVQTTPPTLYSVSSPAWSPGAATRGHHAPDGCGSVNVVAKLTTCMITMRARTARAAWRLPHGRGNCSRPQIAIVAGAGPVSDATNGSGPEFHPWSQATLHSRLATSSAQRVRACRGSSDSRTEPAANPPETTRLDANSQLRELASGHWTRTPNATTAAATAAARAVATRHDGTDPGASSGGRTAALIPCGETTRAPHERAGCIRVRRPRRACGTATGSCPRRP